MRSASRLALFVVTALLAAAGTARADTVGFSTDFQPNIVNLWSNVPFPTIASGQIPAGGAFNFSAPGWGVTFSPTAPNFVQIVFAGPAGSLPPTTSWLNWSQNVNGTIDANFKMDWQEVYYDFSSHSVIQGFAGRLNGTAGGGFANGTYAATPGLGPTTAGGAPLFVGPTPEPSSLIAFGLGLGVVGVARRRRARRKTA